MLLMMVVVIAMLASGSGPMDMMMGHEKPAHQVAGQRGADPDQNSSSTVDDKKGDASGVEDAAARN